MRFRLCFRWQTTIFPGRRQPECRLPTGFAAYERKFYERAHRMPVYSFYFGQEMAGSLLPRFLSFNNVPVPAPPALRDDGMPLFAPVSTFLRTPPYQFFFLAFFVFFFFLVFLFLTESFCLGRHSVSACSPQLSVGYNCRLMNTPFYLRFVLTDENTTPHLPAPGTSFVLFFLSWDARSRKITHSIPPPFVISDGIR